MGVTAGNRGAEASCREMIQASGAAYMDADVKVALFKSATNDYVSCDNEGGRTSQPQCVTRNVTLRLAGAREQSGLMVDGLKSPSYSFEVRARAPEVVTQQAPACIIGNEAADQWPVVARSSNCQRDPSEQRPLGPGTHPIWACYVFAPARLEPMAIAQP